MEIETIPEALLGLFTLVIIIYILFDMRRQAKRKKK